MGIVDSALLWAETQAVTAISGSWFKKKNAASESNFQAE